MTTYHDAAYDRDAAAAFFAQHAGMSYNPATETPAEGKLRGAYRLADDEAWGKDAGVTFEWVDDETEFDSDITDDEGFAYVPETHEGCIARLAPKGCNGPVMVESLWSIADADDDYRRVVEAELTSELRYRLANG